jgi:hypothetical protein
MKIFQNRFSCAPAVFALLTAGVLGFASDESIAPPFGQDTVLVWRIRNLDMDSEFVVRIAEFHPDRYLEWEDEESQGTVFMPSRDVQGAKNYIWHSLFEAGTDTRGENATTLWLSRRIYSDLKEKGKAKCELDGVSGQLKYLGNDQLAIDVNRSSKSLPVIKVSDGRGSELWFLDDAENPLMVKHVIRNFEQVLESITTDQSNTLRWIKGTKLINLPH